MEFATRSDQARIIYFDEVKVAALEHRGDPRLTGNSVRKFIEWRKQNNLPPQTSATFNIIYTAPNAVAPEDYRLDICAATDRDIPDNPLDIASKTIPAGRCAVLRHIGSDDTLGETVKYLYVEWLPQSGEQLRKAGQIYF